MITSAIYARVLLLMKQGNVFFEVFGMRSCPWGGVNVLMQGNKGALIDLVQVDFIFRPFILPSWEGISYNQIGFEGLFWTETVETRATHFRSCYITKPYAWDIDLGIILVFSGILYASGLSYLFSSLTYLQYRVKWQISFKGRTRDDEKERRVHVRINVDLARNFNKRLLFDAWRLKIRRKCF